MSESYQEFDHAGKAKNFLSLDFLKIWSNLKLKKTEIFLGFLAVVAIIVCIILGIVIATSKNSKTSVVKPETCLTMGCLRGASFTLANLNTSVDPCTNFYKYACGGFPTLVQLDSKTSSKTALDLILDSNTDKIKRIIEAPHALQEKSEIKTKVKNYYQSCTDSYQKEKARGYPVLTKIIPSLGGWSVQDNWSSTSWDFQDAFLKASRDFSILAFFRFIVTVDRYHRDRRVIEIGNVGLSMPKKHYLSDDIQMKSSLKSYMRASAELYARDSNITMNEEVKKRLDTFVTDAYDIEYRLAKDKAKFCLEAFVCCPKAGQINSTENASYDQQLPRNRVAVRKLRESLGDAIDVRTVLKEMFKEAQLTDDELIVIHNPSSVKQAFQMIKNLGPNKNRMLNNYLIWRTMDRYNHDLSSEYLHIKQNFYVKRTREKNFPTLPLYCLQNIESHFSRALGSFFVQDHFADRNKEAIQDLLNTVKEEIIESTKGSAMYDSVTKKRAIDKIKAVQFNVGYPDFMMNNTIMDNYYKSLTISTNDYFSNVLNTNTFTMKKFATLLSKRVTDRDTWMYQTYNVNITFDYSWNVLDIPAGLLQFPLYNAYLPHYIRYGTVGVPLAVRFVHAIDFLGGNYDANGNIRTWWTNVTHNLWGKEIKCMEKYFMDQTMGPFQITDQSEPIMMRVHPHYSVEGMSYISGIEIAFKAYKRWAEKNNPELPYPGLGLTNDQMFFLAYAQTTCYNRDDRAAYDRVMRGIVLEDTLLNSALPYTKAFSAAFKCPSDSQMAPQTKCRVFPS